MSKSTRVTSIEQLIKILSETSFADFALALNGGVYSRKEMAYDADTEEFYILNSIDGTTQYLSRLQLLDDELTHIGTAINQNAFWHITF